MKQAESLKQQRPGQRPGKMNRQFNPQAEGLKEVDFGICRMPYFRQGVLWSNQYSIKPFPPYF
jgi:hypothetical protein